MKKVALLAWFFALAWQSAAQNVLDVIYVNPSVKLGTPRFVATGGAFTALGNDFSGVHLNPAGLAVFRHDEFGMSMGWNNRTVYSSYYGTAQSQNYNGIILTSFGYVLNFKTDDPDVSWNFGITWNKNSDFSSESETFGVNTQSSILQDWINNANGIAPDDLISQGLLYEGLAWESYLLDVSGTNQYSTEASITSTEQVIAERIRGSYDELGISLAKNDGDKLYYGVMLNVPFYRYNVEYSYAESGYGGDSIKGMNWRETFTNNGIGINAKFGAIYRPTRNVRIGVSLFTPTFMGITQEYSTTITSIFRNAQDFSVRYESDAFKYNFRNAPQANIGLSYVFDQNGFISIEYNFIPIKWTRSSTYDLSYLNADTKELLKNQQSIKVGGEMRLMNVYLRAGYTWLSNPFNIVTENATQQTYSFGIGYRKNRFTVDISYAIQQNDFNYYPYSANLVEPARQTITRKPLILSASFRL